MAICDLDVAPAFERSKHHEEIGGAIALVLIIETGRASRFHQDRHARFGNELLISFAAIIVSFASRWRRKRITKSLQIG